MSKKLPSFSVNKYEEIFRSPIFIDQNGEWYKKVGYQDTLDLIRENIQSSAEAVIAIGYYLKHLNINNLFKEGGYETIWECAKEEFGITRSTASRYMDMNDLYSVNGDSPLLNEKYKEFNKGQLQELLYLPAETREQKIESISPSETVKGIRNIVVMEKAKEKAKQEPSGTEIHSFYEYVNLSEQPRNSWKEYLQSQHGKRHHGGSNGKLDFQCTPRGIKINKYDEITWHRYTQLLNEYLSESDINDEALNKCATSHISGNEQLPGQMTIIDYPEIIPEKSEETQKNCQIEDVGCNVNPMQRIRDTDNDIMDYVCNELCKHHLLEQKTEDRCRYCRLSELLTLRLIK